MRPFGPLPRTRPRSTPSSRAKRRIVGDACTGPLGPVCAAAGATGTAPAAEPFDDVCAGAVETGERAFGGETFLVRPGVAVATVARTVPWETLSPTFTFTSRIVPPVD